MHHRLDLAADFFIETPFIIPNKDGRALLPVHYANVTTVLTPAILLLIASVRAGRGMPSLIIPLQLKTENLSISDGIGRRDRICAFAPGIGHGQLERLAELIFHADFHFTDDIER